MNSVAASTRNVSSHTAVTWSLESIPWVGPASVGHPGRAAALLLPVSGSCGSSSASVSNWPFPLLPVLFLLLFLIKTFAIGCRGHPHNPDGSLLRSLT